MPGLAHQRSAEPGTVPPGVSQEELKLDHKSKSVQEPAKGAMINTQDGSSISNSQQAAAASSGSGKKRESYEERKISAAS